MKIRREIGDMVSDCTCDWPYASAVYVAMQLDSVLRESGLQPNEAALLPGD
ncbi:MAG: hypothetical protein Q8P81_02645 [Nanoarchaeota archaeon]|nr:hypothetical protein [Nanoarchaeota archaeon]